MSKFAKTAIAAAMVMGAVVSSSAFAAGNNGTARFYGTIEDSSCSIVPDDHKLEVDMGDIGAAKLTGGGTTTPKDFQIRLQDCVFTTETNMETTFTGTNYAGPANADNYALFNVDSGVAMNHGGRIAMLGIPPSDMSIDWTKVIFKGLFIVGTPH